jgi:hypothetical protein
LLDFWITCELSWYHIVNKWGGEMKSKSSVTPFSNKLIFAQRITCHKIVFF